VDDDALARRERGRAARERRGRLRDVDLTKRGRIRALLDDAVRELEAERYAVGGRERGRRDVAVRMVDNRRRPARRRRRGHADGDRVARLAGDLRLREEYFVGGVPLVPSYAIGQSLRRLTFNGSGLTVAGGHDLARGLRLDTARDARLEQIWALRTVRRDTAVAVDADPGRRGVLSADDVVVRKENLRDNEASRDGLKCALEYA
jgi:hypothetical protein